MLRLKNITFLLVAIENRICHNPIFNPFILIIIIILFIKKDIKK